MFLSEKSSNGSSSSIGSFILLRSKQIETPGRFFKVCRGLLLDKYEFSVAKEKKKCYNINIGNEALPWVITPKPQLC